MPSIQFFIYAPLDHFLNPVMCLCQKIKLKLSQKTQILNVLSKALLARCVLVSACAIKTHV